MRPVPRRQSRRPKTHVGQSVDAKSLDAASHCSPEQCCASLMSASNLRVSSRPTVLAALSIIRRLERASVTSLQLKHNLLSNLLDNHEDWINLRTLRHLRGPHCRSGRGRIRETLSFSNLRQTCLLASLRRAAAMEAAAVALASATGKAVRAA
ncbi:hypothetical protein LshimejAT787_1701820 [Lyophyllum shimeji]|uniref:Uncharacterized protein n=1 Tax=Lyophyllum shimeji TaxID=47721 RepID=A0A9P3PYW9_LYOSH|nr:hypothetical protein LshimejAT787_1701820 [Lyophyllum shimeji]